MRRTTVVVCGANHVDGSLTEKYTFDLTEPTKPKWNEQSDTVGWEWKGVYAWDDEEPLPGWRKVKKFLII